MFKRGLSKIIADVLMVLLILIAVGILFFFLRSFILTSGERTGGIADCLQVQLTPVQCTYLIDLKPKIILRRDAGEGNVSLINFIFENNQTLETEVRTSDETFNQTIPDGQGGQTIITVENPVSIGIYDTERYLFSSLTQEPTSVRVTISINDNICASQSKEIPCLPAETSCPDVDIDQAIEVPDIFGYLSAWHYYQNDENPDDRVTTCPGPVTGFPDSESQTICEQIGCRCADTDSDGIIDVSDLMNFLSTWFSTRSDAEFRQNVCGF